MHFSLRLDLSLRNQPLVLLTVSE